MPGTSVGKGVVDITADTSTLGAEVSKGVDAQGGAISAAFSKIGKAGGAALVGAAGLAVGAFAGLAAVGSKFDDAFDNIRITTGKTGDQLTGLQDDFKAVAASVPTSFGNASDAIADLNQRLGLTGKPLQDLSTQFINLSRITDTDLNSNIQAATGLFNQYGIAASDQGPKLDELFRVSQQTGVSFQTLSDSLSSGGPAFRSAGLSFEESAGLVGLLAKNGLSASDVIPALSKSMAQAAKDGKDAGTVFSDTFNAIKNAPNDTAAAGVALDTFGAKAGPKFAELIRTGQLSYEEFAASIAGGGDTINKAAADTDDWKEKLQLLTNKALVLLEPIATKVFDAIGKAIEYVTPYVESLIAWLGEKLPPVIEAISTWVQANWPKIKQVMVDVFSAIIDRAQQVVAWFQTNVLPTLEAIVAWVIAHWPQISAVISTVMRTIGRVINVIVQDVLPALISAITTVVNWVRDHWQQIATTTASVFGRVRAVIEAAVNWIRTVALPVITAIVQWIGDRFGDLVGWIQEHWAEISRVIDSAWTIIKAIITVAAAVVYGLVVGLIATIEFIWDHFGTYIVDAFRAAWDLLSGIVSAAVEIIAGIVNFFGDLFKGDWGKLWGDVKDILQGVWDAIKAVVQAAIDAVVLILETAWEVIKIAVQAGWDAIKLVVSTVWDGIKAAIQLVIDAISALLSAAWDAIKSVATTAWDGIKSAASTAWDAVKTAITAPIDLVKDILGTAWDAIKSAATTVWDSVKTAADTAWDLIKTAITAPIDLVKSTLQTIWDDIKSAATTVWDAISSAVGPAVGVVVAIFDTLAAPIQLAIQLWHDLQDLITDDVNGKVADGGLVEIGANGQPIQRKVKVGAAAGGAVLSTPTLLVAGDAGIGNAEFIAPQKMMTDTMLAALRTHDATNQTMTLPDKMTLVIEGTPFTAIVQRNNQELAETIRAGRRF